MILIAWYKSLLLNITLTSTPCKDMVGDTKNIENRGLELFSQMASPISGIGSGVMFGTGTVEPTFEDYKFSGDVISNISIGKTEIEKTTEKCSYAYTVTNNNTDAITIGEIGIGYRICSTAYGNGNGFALHERTLLDEPVTIEPNGSAQITYTVECSFLSQEGEES